MNFQPSQGEAKSWDPHCGAQEAISRDQRDAVVMWEGGRGRKRGGGVLPVVGAGVLALVLRKARRQQGGGLAGNGKEG